MFTAAYRPLVTQEKEYEISATGNVRKKSQLGYSDKTNKLFSRKVRFINKKWNVKKERFEFKIGKETFSLAEAILWAFEGAPVNESYPEAMFKDGNRKNVVLANLYWKTI